MKVEQKNVHAVPAAANGLTNVELTLRLIFKTIRTDRETAKNKLFSDKAYHSWVHTCWATWRDFLRSPMVSARSSSANVCFSIRLDIDSP